MPDRALTCADCRAAFTFTGPEQAHYAAKHYADPRRCPACRRRRRAARANGGPRRGDGRYPIVCAECGREDAVPFEPKEGRPVYCRACWAKRKPAAAPAG